MKTRLDAHTKKLLADYQTRVRNETIRRIYIHHNGDIPAEKLAAPFGLTRQRVYQIVNEGK